MEYLKLSGCELLISRIGFGSWAVGGHGWGKVDDDSSIRTIQTAVDMGINFFDTADVYGFGHSEEILSQALGDMRHSMVIATKFGVTWDEQGKIGRDSSPEYVVKALEDSLRRLRLDAIPIYQIHWPDGKTAVEDTIAALMKCRDQGKIRYLGCSNFPMEMLSRALQAGLVHFSQLPFSLINREQESLVRAITETNQLGVIAYDVLAKGLLTGKFTLSDRFGPDDVRSRDPNFTGERFAKHLELADALGVIGRNYGKTAGQVAIRWVLDTADNMIALTGAKQIQQIIDNAGASEWSLSRSDWEYLSNLTESQQT